LFQQIHRQGTQVEMLGLKIVILIAKYFLHLEDIKWTELMQKGNAGVTVQIIGSIQKPNNEKKALYSNL